MLSLAWRDLRRQGRRSMVAAVAVALVVFMAIVIYAMGGAMKNSLYQDLTEQAGHVQVHVAGFRDARDFASSLMPADGALDAVLAREAPDAATVRTLIVPALVAGETRSRGTAVVAQERSATLESAFLDDHLTAGTGLPPASPDGVLLGASLASSLRLELGDPVYLYAPGSDGIGAAAYRLVGLLSFDDPDREIAAVQLSLAAAQELAAPGGLSRIELRLPGSLRVQDDAVAIRTAEAIAAALGPEYQVDHWRSIDPTINAMIDFLTPIMVVYSVIFFVLAGLLVLNTIYLSTLERVREFGLLLALGAGSARVVRVVTLQSVIVCVGGAAIGVAVGLGTVALLSDGFRFPGMDELMAEVGMNPVFYPAIEPWQVALAVGFAVLTGVAAAAGPARMASRISPSEAMRHTV